MMMKSITTSRRRFFGLMPGGALAVKQAAEQTMLKLASGAHAPRTILRDTLRETEHPNTTAGQTTEIIPGFNWGKLRDEAITKALNTPARPLISASRSRHALVAPA
ncbi:MAG: hypothetical protein GEU95_01135 [Rhizobiales bacterium]|nr:hypothetical protein [Hyphomicrobiales bacterium]